MPINREPFIYQGYVISQIGQNSGEREEMEYKHAQNCVMSGTHRWADDETDLPNTIQQSLQARQLRDAEMKEADRLHNERLKQQGSAKSVEDLIAGAARPVVLVAVDGKVYLARPFPQTTVFSKDILESWLGVVTVTGEGDTTTVEIGLENAEATYRPISVGSDRDILESWPGDIVAELLESALPEVDIPADWRERHFLQNVKAAKVIRNLDPKVKMTKVEAEAILEEWTKADDPVRVEEQAPAQKPGEGPEAGNRDDRPFNPEAAAKEAERKLLDDGDGDVDALDKGGAQE